MPRPGGVAEDDGWVLALVFDGALERSQLVILDAQRLSGGLEEREQEAGLSMTLPTGHSRVKPKVVAGTGVCPPVCTVVVSRLDFYFCVQLGRLPPSSCPTCFPWACTAAGQAPTWAHPPAR